TPFKNGPVRGCIQYWITTPTDFRNPGVTPMTTVLTKSFPEDRPLSAKAAIRKKRVLIIGGGFAGIAAARALKRADVEITLIDRRNHHIFQPLLYQVATAVLAPSEIAAPIRQLEAKQKNLSVLLAEIKGINPGTRTVEAICPGIGSRKLEYDFLVIATGMRPSYFGHDEFARFAPGVELAASIAHMAAVTLRKNFRRIDPSKSRILLLDAGARVLPTFAESL